MTKRQLSEVTIDRFALASCKHADVYIYHRSAMRSKTSRRFLNDGQRPPTAGQTSSNHNYFVTTLQCTHCAINAGYNALHRIRLSSAGSIG